MRSHFRFGILLFVTFVIFYLYWTPKSRTSPYSRKNFREKIKSNENNLFRKNRQNLIDDNEPFLNFTLMNDKYLIDHTRRIIDFCCGKRVGLLIFIISRPKSIHLRDSFRKVFKNRKKAQYKDSINKAYGICYVYVIGYDGRKSDDELVDMESLKYSDVIRIPILESYYNLPKKVMVSLAILNHFSHKFNYVVKSDDDTVIKAKYILADLYKKFTAFEFIGFIKQKAEVIRDREHKSYLSKELYPDDVFPDYPQGNGYIIRSDAIVKIINQYNNSTYIKFDDVLIGIILRDANMSVASYDRLRYCPYGTKKVQNCYLIEINSEFTPRLEYLKKYEHDFN